MIQKFHSSIDNPPKPKTLMQKDTCTPMFIEALFTIAKTWKQPKCPSTDELDKEDVVSRCGIYMCGCVLSCSVVSNSLWPMDCNLPGSSVHGILSGLPFSTPGYIPDPWIDPVSLESPALAGRFFISAPPGKSKIISSVQLSHSVKSNSLWPHGLQHARLPCPSPTSGAYSNSCPSSW